MLRTRIAVFALLVLTVLGMPETGNAAGVRDVTVTALGEGDSYEAALQSALQDAVRQVNGSVIRTDVRRTVEESEQIVVSGDEEHQNQVNTQGTSGGSREVLKGFVKGHRLKSKRELPGGRIEVTIEANVQKYESPLGSERGPKIAVLAFRAAMPEFGVGGKVRTGGRIGQDLGQRVEKVMSQSGQFTMLSRNNEAEMASEEAFIGQKAPIVEQVKVGQRLGADFIVVGEVRDCVVAPPVASVSRLTGKKRVTIAEATLRVNCRMLAVSTSQIAYADDFTVELTGEKLRAAAGRTEDVYEKLLDLAATKILESADVFMLQQNK